MPSHPDVVCNQVKPYLLQCLGITHGYIHRGPHHCVWDACQPSAMLSYDGNNQVVSMSPAQDSMSHYQTVALTSRLPCKNSADPWRSVLCPQHAGNPCPELTCLLGDAPHGLGFIDIARQQTTQIFKHCHSHSSFSSYAVNHILRAHWESLPAVTCCFGVRKSLPNSICV